MKIELFRAQNILVKFILISSFLVLLMNPAKSQDADEIFQQGNSLSLKGKYLEALMYVDSSLNIDSTLYQRYGFRAELKAKLGMLESAIDDVTRCIQKCRCTTRKYHVASYYLERAELHLLNNKGSDAIEDVNKSISIHSRSWQAYYLRSSISIKSGNLQDALLDLNRSINVDDNQATTFIARGKLKIEMGDINGACNDLSKVVTWGFDEYQPWISENCK